MDAVYFEGETVVIVRVSAQNEASSCPRMENFAGVVVGEGLPLPSGGFSSPVVDISPPLPDTPDTFFVTTKTDSLYVIVRQVVVGMASSKTKRLSMGSAGAPRFDSRGRREKY